MAKHMKRIKKLTGKMQRKLVLMFALVLVALIVLNVRLLYINAASGDKYTKKVLSQMGYRSETIPFRRGAIKDINGETLAISEKVYYVILDCKVLNTVNDKIREKVQNETIQALCQHFEELDETTIRGYLQENPKSSYMRILKEVPYDTVQAFKDQQEDNAYIKGVWFEETYIRKYPNDHLASNVIGFTISGDVGSWGIEQYYNEELNGITGRTYGYLNDDSNLETMTKAAVDGNNVVLHIDAGIQKIVEKHVAAFNEEMRNNAQEGLGSKTTAVIVADPNTGAILAECSYPYYNLNEPRDLTYLGQYTEQQVENMSDEEKQEKMTTIWKNFCISDTYEPGSTFKPFTTAMGLESGKLTGQESYYCNGYEVVDNVRVKCSHTSGHGSLTFEGAIAKSCNDALMQMSYAIGVDTFVKYQSIFGFGKKTGIDLQGEVNAAGLLFTADKMQSIDLAVNSFGQNFNVTMTQMMAGFCSLINGGYYYQPQVAARIENADGEVIRNIQPRLLKQTISQETSEIIRQELKAVVEYGTGRSARVEGYSIGGKTGTAEKFPRGSGKYLVSFVACAPAENPELAFYVVIDEPNAENQANSWYAVTLCQSIMAEVLPYYGVTMEDEEAQAQPETDWSVTGEDTESWTQGESHVDGEVDMPDGQVSDGDREDYDGEETDSGDDSYEEDTDEGDSGDEESDGEDWEEDSGGEDWDEE